MVEEKFNYWKIQLCVKKLNLLIFVHVSEQKFSPGRRRLLIPPKQRSLKIYFSPSRKEERLLIPLNLQWYQSSVLINYTIFAAFAFMVSVLLCHN